MARQARLFISQCPVLIQLQGVVGQDVFLCRQAFGLFLNQMPASASTEGVQIHAWCLVPKGAQLLISALEPEQVGRFVQNINRHFSPQVRKMQDVKTASLWEPRFKSTVVQPGLRSLQACLFVEQFALRQGQASDGAIYPWSSFGAHCGVVSVAWLTDLPYYWQLGNTPFERQVRYREFSENLGGNAFDNLADCLAKGWLWCDDAFALQIGPLANRAVKPRPRGRPRLDANA